MIYQDGSVSVDESYVRVGQRSYYIPEITGLEITTASPHSAAWAYGLLGLGAYVVLLEFFQRFSFKMLIIGAILLWAGRWQWQRSQIRTHSLTIHTKTYPELAYTSDEPDKVLNLRAAIETVRAQRA